jgi:hypothetical protein
MEFPDLTTFRTHFDNIDNALKIWDSQSEIFKIIKMDYHFIKIGILYKQLKFSNRP